MQSLPHLPLYSFIPSKTMLQYHTHLARLQPALPRTDTTFISEKQTRSGEGGLRWGQLEIVSHVVRRLVGRLVVLMVLSRVGSSWWYLLLSAGLVSPSLRPRRPSRLGEAPYISWARTVPVIGESRVGSSSRIISIIVISNTTTTHLTHTNGALSLSLTHFIVKPETSILIWQWFW